MITINEKAEKLLREPGFSLFRHKGLLCCILRHSVLGQLNGYVAIEEAHPCYNKDFEGIKVSVHGGLTYGADSLPIFIEKDVFEKPLYWLGFDTAHYRDVFPFELRVKDIRTGEHVSALEGLSSFDDSTYKDFEYVKEEVISLADQLSKLSKPSKKTKK